MKTKTVRKLIRLYANMAIIINAISVVSVLLVRNVLNDILDSAFGMALSVLLIITVSSITLMLLAGSITRAYNKKLVSDANEIAHDLRRTHKASSECFNKMIEEINK